MWTNYGVATYIQIKMEYIKKDNNYNKSDRKKSDRIKRVNDTMIIVVHIHFRIDSICTNANEYYHDFFLGDTKFDAFALSIPKADDSKFTTLLTSVLS